MACVAYRMGTSSQKCTDQTDNNNKKGEEGKAIAVRKGKEGACVDYMGSPQGSAAPAQSQRRRKAGKRGVISRLSPQSLPPGTITATTRFPTAPS